MTRSALQKACITTRRASTSENNAPASADRLLRPVQRVWRIQPAPPTTGDRSVFEWAEPLGGIGVNRASASHLPVSGEG